MSDLRSRTFSDLVAGLNAGQHLAVDALVAFVDGELSATAHERAAAHLAGCRTCAAEVAGQRQARSIVRSADGPRVPAGLLATLRAIPHTTALPDAPDGRAATARNTADAGSERTSSTSPASGRPLGAGSPLGSGRALGSGNPLGASPRWGTGRRYWDVESDGPGPVWFPGRRSTH